MWMGRVLWRVSVGADTCVRTDVPDARSARLESVGGSASVCVRSQYGVRPRAGQDEEDVCAIAVRGLCVCVIAVRDARDRRTDTYDPSATVLGDPCVLVRTLVHHA